MKYSVVLLALAASASVSALKVVSLDAAVDHRSHIEAQATDKPWYGRGNGTHWTTVVSTDYVTFCPEPTTMIHGGNTYTVTKPMTITITDCPCTFTHPIKPTSTEEPCADETAKPEEPTHKPYEPSTISYVICNEEPATATATGTPAPHTEPGNPSPEHNTELPLKPAGADTKTINGHVATKGSETPAGTETGSPVRPTPVEFTGAAVAKNAVEGGVLGLMVWGAAMLL